MAMTTERLAILRKYPGAGDEQDLKHLIELLDLRDGEIAILRRYSDRCESDVTTLRAELAHIRGADPVRAMDLMPPSVHKEILFEHIDYVRAERAKLEAIITNLQAALDENASMRASIAARDAEIAQLRMREASVLHVGSCADAMLVHLETGSAWECTCECGAPERALKARIAELTTENASLRESERLTRLNLVATCADHDGLRDRIAALEAAAIKLADAAQLTLKLNAYPPHSVASKDADDQTLYWIHKMRALVKP